MDPGTVLMCKINGISDRVEGSAVNISCLQADDQRGVARPAPRCPRERQADPTLIIGRNHDARASPSQKPQRHVDGLVAFLANDHGHRRRPCNPSRSTSQPARRNTS